MPKKLKILRIIARLNIGGPAIHTILLTHGLDKSRFESILVTGLPEKSEGDMLYLAEQKNVRPIIIPQLKRNLDLRNDFIAFWKILSLLIKEKPHIVHTHTAKAGTLGRLSGLLYNLVSRKNRCILIHTFHGHVLHSYFGRVRSRLFIWIERFLALFTTRIIAVSENLKKELVELKIARPGKIIAVPLGLELEKYLKIEANSFENRESKLIGIIGRLVPVKNHKMFLDVVKRIRQELGSRQRMRFLIVGDGPLRAELEEYAEKLGVRQDVTFSGWIEDLTRIYSELDIVALTSLNEGTPVALIEAQASARPCVATKVGGVVDVVEDGKNGFLVPSEDIENFVQALIKLLNDPGLMKTMGRCGRDKFSHRFNKMRLINDIEVLYRQELVNRKDIL